MESDPRVGPPQPQEPGLPYGPWLLKLLGPLRKGFRVFNRWLTSPLYRAGLGPLMSNPLTGSVLVLRTTGRKSGLVREAPLAYAIVDGTVVVAAGFGRDAHWFRNAMADPRVEVVLPGAVFTGHAREISDPGQARRAFRAVIEALGVLGRTTVGHVDALDDDRIDAFLTGFPLLQVTPTGILPGPYDPGGRFWWIPFGLTVLLVALLAVIWL
jgi:deazaflavin-dependent oxidoreductase (nitroreductase family)